MQVNEYFQKIQTTLRPFVDLDVVSKRYQYILDHAETADIAQTPNCWLDFPVIEPGKKYQTVLATDEFFTYTTEHTQQKLIEDLAASVHRKLIITVRDFKNSYRSEVNSVFNINQDQFTLVIAENVRNHAEDRQSWYHTSYVIKHDEPASAEIITVGPVQRRAVYFKQLAKFCFDAGCKQFQVIPNASYRPIFKKHLEHIIVVDF